MPTIDNGDDLVPDGYLRYKHAVSGAYIEPLPQFDLDMAVEMAWDTALMNLGGVPDVRLIREALVLLEVDIRLHVDDITAAAFTATRKIRRLYERGL